jgi:protein ImuB
MVLAEGADARDSVQVGSRAGYGGRANDSVTEVRTVAGAAVTVDARLALNGPPATVRLGREPPVEVTGWAGPWPVEERWWAPGEADRIVRFQLSLADGRALLMAVRDGRWSVEAFYD